MVIAWASGWLLHPFQITPTSLSAGSFEADVRPGAGQRRDGMDTIEFYSARGAYGGFSNFSPHPIFLDGARWPTSEHYFQAMKFAGTEHVERIRRAASPKKAAEMGRDRRRPLRRDWEAVKDDVMRRVIRAKFSAHSELRELLLGTGESRLVEASPTDRYWGAGAAGDGRNMLGLILMEIRSELRRG